MRQLAMICLFVLAASACSGAQHKKGADVEEMIAVDVSVDGLAKDDEQKLEDELAKIPGVFNLHRDVLGSGTMFSFDYSGDLHRLRAVSRRSSIPGCVVSASSRTSSTSATTTARRSSLSSPPTRRIS